MKRLNVLLPLLVPLIFINGCSTIKKFWPEKRGAKDDISYELIENLSDQLRHVVRAV